MLMTTHSLGSKPRKMGSLHAHAITLMGFDDANALLIFFPSIQRSNKKGDEFHKKKPRIERKKIKKNLTHQNDFPSIFTS